MKTQVKDFSINLLRELLQQQNFINNHTDEDKAMVMHRWENGVSQKLIYAIENDEGGLEILENNVVETLIQAMDNTSKISERRALGLANHKICILSYPTKAEEELFRLITK